MPPIPPKETKYTTGFRRGRAFSKRTYERHIKEMFGPRSCSFFLYKGKEYVRIDKPLRIVKVSIEMRALEDEAIDILQDMLPHYKIEMLSDEVKQG